jgi:hypothetical protein
MAYPTPGTGVTLALGTMGTNATFTAYLRDVSGPSISRPAIDISSNGSPQGTATGNTAYNQLYREKKPGVVDVGELSLDIVYDPNAELPVNEPNETWTLTFPGPTPGFAGASFACDAFCSGAEPATPWEGEMTARITVALSGIPTWATAATAA